ncbi:MAG: hypothetical protein AAFP84_04770 [Actinomycetota bacterium]
MIAVCLTLSMAPTVAGANSLIPTDGPRSSGTAPGPGLTSDATAREGFDVALRGVAEQAPPPPPPPPADNSGEFTALPPTRILDTRPDFGSSQTLGRRDTLRIPIAGRGGVPAQGVSAVVMNATAVGATAPTFVSIWPTGAPLPNVSNLNPSVGGIAANMVTIALGDDGSVQAFNLDGSTDLLLDVVGYYSTADGPNGARFVSLQPSRAIDTRENVPGRPRAPMGPRSVETFDFNPLFEGGVVGAGVTALVANVTITEPTAPSFLTVTPHGNEIPNASHVNFFPGQTIPNLVTVQVPPTGLVDFFNLDGSAHLIVDVVGVYTAHDDLGGFGRFVPLPPVRAGDTRDGFGVVGPDELIVVNVATDATGVPAEAQAIAANVTVTETTSPGFVTVFTDDSCVVPNASNLNFGPGETTANAAIVGVSAGLECANGPGRIDLYNALGDVHLIVDVSGYFTGVTPASSSISLDGLVARDRLAVADR